MGGCKSNKMLLKLIKSNSKRLLQATLASKTFFYACILTLTSIITIYLLPLPTIYNKENTSKAFLDRNNRLIKVTLSGDEKYRVFVPLNDIPNEIVQSTLQYEDRYFYYHFGINPFATIRSILKTVLTGRPHGGSTLTMQLARIRYGLKTRTVWGKLKQIIKAIQIEFHYTKTEVLEAYFNLAPYGGNIEGIGAASLLLLNKIPNDLTINDANWLSLIPQSPTRRNPRKTAGRENLKNISTHHPKINSKTSYLPLFIENTKINTQNDSLYNEANHFVERIADISPIGINYTTLDLNRQKQINNILNDYIDSHKNIGIENGSVMVLDTEDMSVVSYLGSKDYYSTKIKGFVNGITAKRSPGSTIKPFIYGLGIDQGIITPDSLLKDTPINISSYVPDNFEKDFLGPINATEALVRSRNIPAVNLMNRLKNPTIYQYLKDNGIKGLRSEEYYGLALALGGFEITMEELIKFYASLSNSGKIKEIKFLDNKNSTQQSEFTNPELLKTRDLSATAGYLVLKMLATNPLPNEKYTGNDNNPDLPIPWKTGTSFSSKDAWSIGIAGKYLIAVWIGNFDGTPNVNFVGRDVAGPLLFQIINQLKSEETLSFPKAKSPLNITTQKICTLSGQPANDHCPYTKIGFVIPGVSSIKQCNIHRDILVDQTETFQICENSKMTGKHKTYEFLDSDLFKLYELAGLKRTQPPSFAPECADEITNHQIQRNNIYIVSPNKNTIYKAEESNDSNKKSSGVAKIRFQASTQSNSSQLFWFLDNRLLQTATPEQNFIYPLKVGEYLLKVTDGIVFSEEIKIKVEMP